MTTEAKRYECWYCGVGFGGHDDGCPLGPESERGPMTMETVCRALLQTYTDDGIAIWLASPNRLLDGKRGIEVCETEDGRQRVFALAEALADGAFI